MPWNKHVIKHMVITKLFSSWISSKWVYFLNVTPNKIEPPAAGQKALFLVGLTMFKTSNSSLLIFTYFFGINQFIIGRSNVSQLFAKSTIKYSSLYLIILYFGFLLMTRDSQSNVYHIHFTGLICLPILFVASPTVFSTLSMVTSADSFTTSMPSSILWPTQSVLSCNPSLFVW